MLYYDGIDISKKICLAKSNNSKECMICHYLFLIMDSNFNIPYALVVIIFQCCVLMSAMLLFSRLAMLIIVALFTTLTNLKQLIY